MSRNRKWFKSEEYKKPREPFELGDGSLVEVTPYPSRGDGWLRITRVWPGGMQQTVELRPPDDPYGETKYGFVSEGPANAVVKPSLDSRLGNGHYRAPYAITSSVPGNKPGDDYDPGTDRRFPSRAEFERYYEENNLTKLMQTDAKNMAAGSQYETHNPKLVQSYDCNKGDGLPPVPPQFQGKKFIYAK